MTQKWAHLGGRGLKRLKPSLDDVVAANIRPESGEMPRTQGAHDTQETVVGGTGLVHEVNLASSVRSEGPSSKCPEKGLGELR